MRESIIKMLLLIALAICFISSTHGEKLHEHMTNDEIRSIFNVHHDEVHNLEYQVVKIIHANNTSRKLRTRIRVAQPELHLQAFNQNYKLYLEENNNVLLGDKTPVFIAESSSGGRSLPNDDSRIVYSRIKYPLPTNFKLYHDRENRAAVSVHHENNEKFHVNGVVGDNIIIRSLPKRIHDEVLSKFSTRSKRSSIFDDDPFFNEPLMGANSNFGGGFKTTHHVIIKPAFGSFDSTWNDIRNTYINSNQIDDLLNDPNGFISWQGSYNLPKRPVTKLPRPSWKRPTLQTVGGYQPSTKDSSLLNRPTKPSVDDNSIPPWYPTGLPSKSSKPASGKVNSKESNTVYPQLLVTVDYDTFKAHGNSVEELAKYMAAFWNAVDLRYRELSNPAVRLNIAGLIIPKQPESAAYMEKYKVTDDSVLADQTLTSIGEYFAKHLQDFPKDMYDIVVGISYKDLGANENGQFTAGITGIATFQGVCQVEYGNADALVRDKGGFNGITTAAHEVAHTLGAPHDGSASAPDSGACPWNDGYLMSYERKDKRGMHFSKCSAQAMQAYFRKQEAKCLFNKPTTGSGYPKLLPGRLQSRDEQCKKSMGDTFVSSKDSENDCAVLWCTDTSTNDSQSHFRPPAEGSFCAEGAICLNAECVKDPELS